MVLFPLKSTTKYLASSKKFKIFFKSCASRGNKQTQKFWQNTYTFSFSNTVTFDHILYNVVDIERLSLICTLSSRIYQYTLTSLTVPFASVRQIVLLIVRSGKWRYSMYCFPVGETIAVLYKWTYMSYSYIFTLQK